MLLAVDLPSALFDASKNTSAIKRIQAVFYFLYWSFGMRSGHADAIFGFLVHVISTTILIFAAVQAGKRKRVPYWVLWYVRLYQGYFCPWVAFSAYFRLAYCVEFLGNTGTTAFAWMTFVMQLLNVIITFLHIGLASIFLDPIAFTAYSVFDVYDGKTQLVLTFCQFLSCGACHLYNMISVNIVQWLVAVLLLVCCVMIFYLRVMITVHTSLFGQYVEIAPLFSIPFVLLVMSFNLEELWVCLLVIIGVHLVCVMALMINRRTIVKESQAIGRVFLEKDMEDGEEREAADFVSGNSISILRVLARETADPRIFDSFATQSKFENRASRMIEIVRFLGVFPSRRMAMLKVLMKLRSSSNYSRFTIYLFAKILRSLVKSSDEKHKANLDDVQKNYIMHHHGYWKARKDGQFFRAFREGCATCYFYIELRAEIHSLLRRFPFDPTLYHRYTDFLLSANADYDGVCRCMDIVNGLEGNRSPVSDPFLHEAVRFNPLILKYCNESESKSYMCSGSSMTNTTKPQIPIPDRKQPMIAHITKSTRCVPCFPFLCFLLPALFLCALIYAWLPHTNEVHAKTVDISLMAEDVLDAYTATASAIFYPFGLHYQGAVDFNVTTEPECIREFNNAMVKIPEFFGYMPQIEDLSLLFLNLSIPFMHHTLSLCQDACSALRGMPPYFYDLPIEQMELTRESMTVFLNGLEALETSLRNDNKFKGYLLWSFLFFFFFVFVMAAILCVQLNRIMKNEKEAINFLSSDKRSSLLLMERSEEAWECLNEFLQDSANGTSCLTGLNTPVGTSHDTPETCDTMSSLTHTYSRSLTIKSSPGDSDSGDGSTSFELSELDHNETELVTPAVYSVVAHSKLAWINSLLLLFGPSLLMVLIICYMYIPVDAWITGIGEELHQSVDVHTQVSACLTLLEATYNDLMNWRSSVDQWKEADQIIQMYNNPVKQLYNEPKCRYLLGVTCSSISDAVQGLISGKADRATKLFVYLPAIVDFCKDIIEKYMIEDMRNQQANEFSDAIAFFIDTIFAVLFVLYLGFYVHIDITEGFNSLFHFPTHFLRKNQTNNQLQSRSDSVVFPSAVVSVTSSVDTDVIYSVSDNVETLINRSPITLIGTKLSDAFPIVDGQDDIREHLMPDRVTKKHFRCSTTVKRGFQTTLMIAFANQAPNRPNYSQGSLAEKLINFIPPYFARNFEEGDVSNHEFTDALLILVRFHVDLTRQQIEPFFHAINTGVMNYTSIKVIKADGGLIICSTIRQMNPLVGFAFVKDLLNSVRNAETVIHSIHMEFVEHYSIAIDDGNEPFLSIELEGLPRLEQTVYALYREQVSVSPAFLSLVPIEKWRTSLRTIEIGGNEKELIITSFGEFAALVSELMS